MTVIYTGRLRELMDQRKELLAQFDNVLHNRTLVFEHFTECKLNRVQPDIDQVVRLSEINREIRNIDQKLRDVEDEVYTMGKNN